MNKFEFNYYQQCPVCASKNIRDKYKLKEYILAECSKCSLLFVREILSEDFLKKHYASDSNEYISYGSDNELCLIYYYLKLKSEIEKIKPLKGKILDVGCSAGFFLDQMKGWDRYGIEISKTGEIAKQKMGNKIFLGFFEKYPAQQNYFDVITLQDVFDHFIDPNKNLKKCYEMLKPGGLLIIKVHNISCLYAKLTGSKFYAIIPPTHLFYFNKKSLKVLLSKNGFKFYKSKFISHILQLKVIFYRLSHNKTDNFFYKIFKILDNNTLGKVKIYKNLRDIITVFAIKEK